jgi:hypothetical protein
MKNRLLNYWNFLTGVKTQTETLNDLKVLLFRDKTTQESINLFVLLKNDFEQELQKRHLEALNESTSITSYFNPIKKMTYTTVKDSVYNEPIKS